MLRRGPRERGQAALSPSATANRQNSNPNGLLLNIIRGNSELMIVIQ